MEIPRKTQITEVGWRGNRQSEQIYNQKRLLQSFKTLHTEKPRPTWLRWWILPNIQRRINTNHFQTTEEGTLPNSFYKVSITLIPNEKEHHKKITGQYPWITDTKILSKILANHIQQYIKRVIHNDQVGFILWMEDQFSIYKSIWQHHPHYQNEE